MMTKLYIVNYLGGACGAFLTSIIGDFLYGVTPKTISSFGNSHNNLDLKKFNYSSSNYVMNQDKIYNCIDVIDPTKDVLTCDHIPVDWPDFFQKYPNGTNIILTITLADVPRLWGNFFYKARAEYYDPNNSQWWDEWKNRHQPLFSEIDDPRDMPLDIAEKFLRNDTYLISPFYDNNAVIPTEYADKVFHIKMTDIIHNRDLVLDQISHITKKEIPQGVIENYDKYLEAQEHLVRTKMPWVTV